LARADLEYQRKDSRTQTVLFCAAKNTFLSKDYERKEAGSVAEQAFYIYEYVSTPSNPAGVSAVSVFFLTANFATRGGFHSLLSFISSFAGFDFLLPIVLVSIASSNHIFYVFSPIYEKNVKIYFLA
jgi:hypothetical protein